MQIQKEDVQEDVAQSSVHEMSISFGEIDLENPADKSFVPLSKTSPSSPSGSGSGAGSGWEGKKWLVDEFKLMELFQTCRTCAAAIEDKRVVTQGSLIKICWACLNGHTGEWMSCLDTRGMAHNNLLICASILFTGSTYTEIKEWANPQWNTILCHAVEIPLTCNKSCIQRRRGETDGAPGTAVCVPAEGVNMWRCMV